METKALIIDVPVNGHKEKWNITPLASLFDLYDKESIISSLRSVHENCYELYAMSLEDALNDPEQAGKHAHPREELKDDLYSLIALIEQISLCGPIEKSKAA